MKLGRNDPCPCGSGKKHKHCCIHSQPAAPAQSPWARQREASDRFTNALQRFSEREFEKDFDDAWAEFNLMPFPRPYEDDKDERQIFMPWFLFDWDPAPPARRRGAPPSGGLVVTSFVERYAERISDEEYAVLDQAISQPLSFYEVMDATPGESLLLRNLLLGGDTLVTERSASKMLQPGDLSYGQIWRFPEVSTLGRLAPIRIPHGRKVEVIGLRATLRKKIAKQSRELQPRDLIRHAELVRRAYLDIRDGLRTPTKIVNTDGETVLFHTLTYSIGSTQVAFDALVPLASHTTKEEILADAEVDDEGVLQTVTFDWTKQGNRRFETWDNTILGKFALSGRTLVAEVNSSARAALLQKELERRLGIFAVLKGTVCKTHEEMTKEAPRPRDLDAEAPVPDEVPDEVTAFMQAQAESWISQKIPALGGRTPLQAVRNPDGREVVEALLYEWERSTKVRLPQGGIKPDVARLRQLLKLPPRLTG